MRGDRGIRLVVIFLVALLVSMGVNLLIDEIQQCHEQDGRYTGVHCIDKSAIIDLDR